MIGRLLESSCLFDVLEYANEFVFSLMVGSLGMVLYVLVSLSSPMALSMYCCLSMMTIATPLSAVNTTLDWSSLSSMIALNSSTVMFGLMGGTCA